MKRELSKLQLEIIASKVYVYLKAKTERKAALKYDPELDAKEDLALLELSDVLSVYFDKAVKPVDNFDDIPMDAPNEVFLPQVREIISHMSE